MQTNTNLHILHIFKTGKYKDKIKNVDPMDLLFFDAVPQIEPAKIVKVKEFELDLISEDIRKVWDNLGEITGETATEEIINEINKMANPNALSIGQKLIIPMN